MFVVPQDSQNKMQFRKGEVILFPEHADLLYRVVDGLVRVHYVDNEGNGLTLRYVKPQGYFGEESLANLPRRYFAEAVTDTVIEKIAADALDASEREALIQHLATAVESLYQSLYRLAGKRLKARIAAELLELSDSSLSSTNEDGEATVHITHDDLAAAVGSVRETVTKVVGELSRDGAVNAGYGKIRLTNLEQLQHIANA